METYKNYYRPAMPIDVIREVREALQGDLLCYLEKAPSSAEWSVDTLCDIVVENFKKILPPEAE